MTDRKLAGVRQDSMKARSNPGGGRRPPRTDRTVSRLYFPQRPAHGTRPVRASISTIAILLTAFGSLLITGLVAGCGSRTGSVRSSGATPNARPAPAPEAPNLYVGNAACAECHQLEFREHSHSRHSIALRPMDRTELGKQAPPVGPIPGTPYAMTAMGDGYGFGFAGAPTHRLDLAFGSGKSGMAFTIVINDSTMAEAHESYYPAGKKWFTTPGQGSIPDSQLGNVAQGAAARECFPCHTVAMPLDSLIPERRFMGVGCESCHGPGSLHVAAMKSGDLSRVLMPDLHAASAAAITELCGRCHRTQREVVSKDPNSSKSDLFQAFGLQESRCYRESGGRLSCITCHDPHTDASTSEQHYTAVCLQCHSLASHPALPRILQARACPVSPTGRCVECHMPKRPEPLFAGSPRRLADHFIKVYPDHTRLGPPSTGDRRP